MNGELRTVKRMRPLPFQPLSENSLSLFMSHVRRPPNGEDGCWIWTASNTKKGYGRVRLKKRLESPHRISYAQFVGEVPQGMYVLHRCDVGACCNPAHLFLGTCSDNMRDAAAKGRLKTQDEQWRESRRKLNRENVDAVRSLIRQGLSNRAIARRLSVASTTIDNFMQRYRLRRVEYAQ